MLDQGWNAVAALYAQFGAFLSDYPILRSLLGATRGLAMVFVVVFVLEWLTGGNLRRYWTRNFRTDMTYGILLLRRHLQCADLRARRWPSSP